MLSRITDMVGRLATLGGSDSSGASLTAKLKSRCASWLTESVKSLRNAARFFEKSVIARHERSFVCVGVIVISIG